MPEMAYWVMSVSAPRPLYWIGSSKEDLCEFPDEVRREMGYALYLAQLGDKHPNVKPQKSRRGSKTPPQEIEFVRRRLKRAQEHAAQITTK